MEPNTAQMKTADEAIHDLGANRDQGTRSAELEGKADARAGNELARHGDPSLTDRRTALLTKARDRSGLHWVPASEAIRQANTALARSTYGAQTRAHTAVRNLALRPVSVTRDRVAKLGSPRPVRSLGTTGGTREGISR
ncbi:hypothetical protein [Candidatus Corynebacterium faecigallinarum]|uniref:hypothetical protein n=1 Tax=Candidatus Corynebacterium faecigallinarum TaxID=2838528 RepID=UPI003FB85B99